MARGNPGKIVTWTNKDGQTKYGIVRYSEQAKSFTDLKKVLVRHILEDFITSEKDASGKNMVGLVAIEKLKVIGCVD